MFRHSWFMHAHKPYSSREWITWLWPFFLFLFNNQLLWLWETYWYSRQRNLPIMPGFLLYREPVKWLRFHACTIANDLVSLYMIRWINKPNGCYHWPIRRGSTLFRRVLITRRYLNFSEYSKVIYNLTKYVLWVCIEIDTRYVTFHCSVPGDNALNSKSYFFTGDNVPLPVWVIFLRGKDEIWS